MQRSLREPAGPTASNRRRPQAKEERTIACNASAYTRKRREKMEERSGPPNVERLPQCICSIELRIPIEGLRWVTHHTRRNCISTLAATTTDEGPPHRHTPVLVDLGGGSRLSSQPPLLQASSIVIPIRFRSEKMGAIHVMQRSLSHITCRTMHRRPSQPLRATSC